MRQIQTSFHRCFEMNSRPTNLKRLHWKRLSIFEINSYGFRWANYKLWSQTIDFSGRPSRLGFPDMYRDPFCWDLVSSLSRITQVSISSLFLLELKIFSNRVYHLFYSCVLYNWRLLIFCAQFNWHWIFFLSAVVYLSFKVVAKNSYCKGITKHSKPAFIDGKTSHCMLYEPMTQLGWLRARRRSKNNSSPWYTRSGSTLRNTSTAYMFSKGSEKSLHTFVNAACAALFIHMHQHSFKQLWYAFLLWRSWSHLRQNQPAIGCFQFGRARLLLQGLCRSHQVRSDHCEIQDMVLANSFSQQTSDACFTAQFLKIHWFIHHFDTRFYSEEVTGAAALRGPEISHVFRSWDLSLRTSGSTFMLLRILQLRIMSRNVTPRTLCKNPIPATCFWDYTLSVITQGSLP